MKLVLFDLDDTLLSGDTAGEWVRFMDKHNLIKDNNFFEKIEIYDKSYRKGSLDIIEYSNFLLKPLSGRNLKGLNRLINSYAIDMIERFSDDLTKALLNKHKEDFKIITSGSFSFLVRPMANLLGIETIFGTNVVFDGDRFTGELDGSPNFADEKVRRAKEWIGAREFTAVYAYSDSIFDLPLLRFADQAFVISPDKKLKQEAINRSWYIDNTRDF